MRVQVIAEIGINHQASVAVACDLVRVAAAAGCDAIKFQKRTVEDAVPESMKSKPRKTPWGTVPYIQYKHRIEFTAEDIGHIRDCCAEVGLPLFASAFDPGALRECVALGMPMIKIPSACITDLDLLRGAVDSGLPVVMSTGGAHWGEVDAAVEIVQRARRLTLMQTCSTYPHTIEEARVWEVPLLRQRYGFPTGYSGHENPTLRAATIAAVSLGAVMIERHITLSRRMWGSDQKASLEPHELEDLVKEIRETTAAVTPAGVRGVGEEERAKVMTMRRTEWQK